MIKALRTGRLPAVLLTVLLHGVLLALLVYSFQRFVAPRGPARETLLRLPRLIEPKPRTIDARGNPRSNTGPPLFVPPERPARAPPNAANPPDVRALGRALFNCTPEAYANMAREQRVRCERPGEGMAMLEPPNLMGTRSHVKDEAHWQAEWAREQSPVVLPCLGGLNVLCLLKVIATGDFSEVTDPRKWPTYEVKQIPPEDFRKIEAAYDSWHRVHREANLAPAQ